MGLFSKKVAQSNVWLSGVQEYADSGDEEVVIAAQVEVTEERQLAHKEPLPFFGPLGAVRLLSMLRREQHYVIPFMVLTGAVSEELLDEETDPAEFRVRGAVATDPDLLAAAGTDLHTTALNCSLPDLHERLPGESERTTTLELHEARNGMGSVHYKFPMGSSNALITVGAWAATVDYLVRNGSRDEIAIPVGRGLHGLNLIWDNMGNPMEVSLSEGAAIEAHLTEIVASNTPD